MPVLPTDLAFGQGLSARLMRASNWVKAHFSGPSFTADEALDRVALIDERLRPRAPMPKDDIEIITRMNLSTMGLRNAQQVTAESHPELFAAWQTLCQRAGYGPKLPQLIVTESAMANAMEISDSEMVITTGLLKMLTLRETVAVLGHELGHGRHDHMGVRMAALGTFGGAGALVGNYLAKVPITPEPGEHWLLQRLGPAGRFLERHFFTPVPGTLPRPSSLLGSVVMILAGIGIGQIAANQIAVKPTELQADLDGVAISGDPQALASALTKMKEADPRGPVRRWWGYLKSGYPTVEERVDNIRRAAAERPAHPVPAALGPVPGTQVQGVAHAERIETGDIQPTLG